MGAIHLAPFAELAAALKQKYAIGDFVETGTYMGDATAWAAALFPRVWTIEIRADFQAQAKKNTGEPANVTFLLGNSAEQLKQVCAQLRAPAMFWLDAHAGAGYFGKEDNCPLLEEIDVITAGEHQHIMVIDDARAFYAPPPPPFDYTKWPPLEQVMRHVLAKHDYHVVLMIDCLLCVPQSARELIAEAVFRERPEI